MYKEFFLLMIILLQGIVVRAENYNPIANIGEPKEDLRFKTGEKITFKGRAVDLEDGELYKGSLVWTSDLDGVIGRGQSIETLLSDGSHIILLTATDSRWGVGRDSVFITVGDFEISEPNEEIKKPEETEIEKIEEKTLPSLEFTSIPPFGSLEDLKGKLLNGDPNQFSVIVYTMIGGLWFSKPSLENSTISINKDGTWTCDITTAKNDQVATRILAYLVPVDYKPPTASGDFLILGDIEEKSLSKIEVVRKISSSQQEKINQSNKELAILGVKEESKITLGFQTK